MLEGPAQLSERDELRAALKTDAFQQEGEARHLDQKPVEELLFPDHILSGGRYQPFQPPPAPKPMNTEDSHTVGAEAAEAAQPQYRTYTAVLTVEESTDEMGNVTWEAHSSPLVAEDPEVTEEANISEPPIPLSYRERMIIRKQHFEEGRGGRGIERYYAISVKRQRKLKMKKHKYKKLMRRTRNLRRRLDRN